MEVPSLTFFFWRVKPTTDITSEQPQADLAACAGAKQALAGHSQVHSAVRQACQSNTMEIIKKEAFFPFYHHFIFHLYLGD